MDRSLYIAMTGAAQNMAGQTAHANNLSNSNTTGFKADLAQARSMPVFGDHHPSRVYAMSETPSTDFSSGAPIKTDRALDVMLDGPGFLSVLDNNGEEAYSRNGSFQLGSQGELLNGSGLPVLGDGGPIVLPPFSSVTIANDGTISIRGAGQGAETLTTVARLKLVSSDEQVIEKGSDGLFRAKSGDPLIEDAGVNVRSGFVESSNVNAVFELTSYLSLARQFELSVKMMSTIEEMDQSSARILQSS